MKTSNFKNSPITYSLIVICCVIYLYTTYQYSMNMTALEGYEVGGYMPLALYVDFEYYRLITANFIHFGFSHIFMNMLSLYNIGPFMERVYRKKRYLGLIAFSALSSTLLPYIYYLLFKEPFSQMGLTVSGGASGIILGMLGGLCCLTIYYPSLFKPVFKSILPSLGLILFLSLTVPTVSLSGHLGGFIGGFIITFIYTKQKSYYLWHYKVHQDPTNRPC